ncbi:hypothetical protein WJX81_006195 [Elliptochloris bilobata]|uniref:Condensin complex subunit 1 C-terminal domain-containing protein n=1 Tax=Elliptochloris bilobata TaxID=381761 RepID=A0AAW1S7J3_9CHLO
MHAHSPVSIELKQPEADLATAVADICCELVPGWKSLPHEAIKHTVIEGGITNLLWKVLPPKESGLGAVVVRVFGEETNRLINRDRELRLVLQLNEAGFGARVLGTFDNGRIEAWLEMRPLTSEQMTAPAMAQRVARRLRAFHRAPVAPEPDTGREPQLFQTITSWLDMAKALRYLDEQRQARHDAVDFAGMAAEVREVQAAVERMAPPHAFSHNDLLSGNILVSTLEADERAETGVAPTVQFIDFEYGAFGFRGFDWGNHFNEWAGFECEYSRYPKPLAAAAFLHAYLAEGAASPPTEEEVARAVVEADLFALASHQYWGVWALIQARYSPINFDYFAYSALRWGEYHKRKADMQRGTQAPSLRAALFMLLLLQTEGCPVLSLWDSLSCAAVLRLVRAATAPPLPGRAAGGRTGASAKPVAAGSDGEEMDVDGEDAPEDATEAAKGSPAEAGAAQATLAAVLGGLAVLLQLWPLRDHPDTLRSVVETLAEAAISPQATATAADGCFAALAELLAPRHGTVRETAALALRPLAPGLLGSAAAGGSGKAGGRSGRGGVDCRAGPAIRARILAFAGEALRRDADSADALAALARHVVLKAPDRAEARALAATAAVSLVALLQAPGRGRFVAFVARLSRTPKVAQRLLAVELAPALLQALPNPYDAASAIAPAASPVARSVAGTPAVSAAAHDPGTAPGSLAPPSCLATGSSGSGSGGPDPAGFASDAARGAPWGTVCLAVLVQRGSDKAASVRAKALACLAGVAGAWAERAPADPDLLLFRQALAQAHQVRMADPATGTPAIMCPPTLSPAPPGDPGATPLADGAAAASEAGSPAPATGGSGASGAPFVARKRAGGLHRAALENAGAARAAQLMDTNLRPLAALAQRRCADDKAGARRAGVALLEAVLLLRAADDVPMSGTGRKSGGASAELPTAADLAAIEAAAADPLVSVRKAALSAAARLLRALPREASLAALWVRAALPAVRDTEASMQELLLDQFNELVVGRAAAVGAGHRREDAPAPPAAAEAAALLAPILAALDAAGAAGAACVSRVCAALHAKRRLRAPEAAAGLQRVIAGLGAGEVERLAPGVEAGAWWLLAEVAVQAPDAPSWAFLQERWAALKARGASAEDGWGTLLLRVVAAAAGRFPAAEAARLADDLLQAVKSFDLPAAAAAAHVAALAQLVGATRAGNPAGGPKGLAGGTWAGAVLDAAEARLGQYLESRGGGTGESSGSDGGHDKMHLEDWRAATALFTVGEVVMLQARKASGRLLMLVQAFTAPRLAAADPAVAAAVPAPLQAHAWVALGKACLVDEALAKRCVPLFVQELSRAGAPAVRNNIMVALADLMVTFTALVDAHMPKLAACLGDEHELVRRQALALMASLLSRDYVKWRGPLFHRFTRALVDDSAAVRALAEYLLADMLATKAPLLAYNHFVEALFVLNDCRAGLRAWTAAGGGDSQEGPPGASQAEAGAETLSQVVGAPGCPGSLGGPSLQARAKRDAIYRALLVRMAPEHKFATSARLCSEVLAAFAEGALPLGGAGEVLRDALHILACREIRVGGGRGGAAAAGEDEEETGSAAAGAARGRLVGAMAKKHLVESLVPVLVELKRVLEAARSTLLGELLATLRAQLRDHKAEIRDILAGDKQLADELLYDIKQDERVRTAAAAAAAVAGPPAAAAPGSTSATAPAPGTGGTLSDRAGRAPAAPPAAPGAPPHAAITGVLPGTPVAAEVLSAAAAAAARARHAAGGSPAVHGPCSAGTPGPGLARRAALARSALKTPAAAGLRDPGAGSEGAPGSGGRHSAFKTPVPLSCARGAEDGAQSGSWGTSGYFKSDMKMNC